MNGKVALSTVILVHLLVLGSVSGTYTPKGLSLNLYADGKVDVTYTVSIDPVQSRVEIPLFGEIYENLLVLNEEGLPLDHEALEGKVAVDGLGSWRLEIHYTTQDLLNKVGRVWTLSITSPTTFTVRLPKDASIIGLSNVPLAISSLNGYQALTMPKGQQEISYIIGVVGSREQALIRIEEADRAIDEAKTKGIEVSEAETKLGEAKAALDAEHYAEAEAKAIEAKQIVLQAVTEAEAPEPTLIPTSLIWIVMVLALALASIVMLYKRRPPTPELKKEFRRIDVQRILQGKPHLRLEDREAIEFIASAGGEAYEVELRDKFKLPKSTVWRMVKRLEREGLVEIKKVGGQNLIHLIEPKYLKKIFKRD